MNAPTRLFLTLILLHLALIPAAAELTVIKSWERPVLFKAVDASTGEPVPSPLMIVATEQAYEGAPAPVKSYEVFRGDSEGSVEYRASDRVAGAELHVVASGYALLYKSVKWSDLPPRQRDAAGFETGKPPVVAIELKKFATKSDWNRELRLNIGPTLDDFLKIRPPAMGQEGKKLIEEFLNRERDKLIGF